MKKISGIFLLTLIILLPSCLTTKIKKIDNDFSDDEYISIYGQAYNDFVRMSEKDFIQMKSLLKRTTLEDNSLSSDEQESIIMDLEKLVFKENSFFYFYIKSKEPYLKKLLQLKFNLYNKDNESLIENINSFSVKFTTFMNGITFIDYRYFWVIESNKSIIKENFNEGELPILLDVYFPNDKKMKFLILE